MIFIPKNKNDPLIFPTFFFLYVFQSVSQSVLTHSLYNIKSIIIIILFILLLLFHESFIRFKYTETLPFFLFVLPSNRIY